MSTQVNVWPAVLALALAGSGTGILRRYALTTGLLDIPNARSAHVVPVPRGGGLAAVVAALAGLSVCSALAGMPLGMALPVLGAGILIALVGFMDDRRGLSAAARLAVHLGAALVLVASLGLRPIPWPTGPIDLGRSGLVLAWLATVWSINLFNFMDGTDGIAAAQSVFVFGGAAVIAAALPGSAVDVSSLLVCAAASLGFLAWNWPPARIFMGDVGSGFLGYLIAASALLTADSSGLSIWTWLVLNGAFLADATVTLLVRAAHRERVYEAHRSHVYQRLARRWGSHRRVLLVLVAVNVFWLLPLAALTVRAPPQAMWFAVLGVLPLLAAAFLLGAGRPDAA